MTKRRGVMFSWDAIISMVFILLMITVVITKANLIQTSKTTTINTYATSESAQTIWNQIVFSPGNPPDWTTTNPPSQLGLASPSQRGLVSYQKVQDLLELAKTNPTAVKTALSYPNENLWLALKLPDYTISLTQYSRVRILKTWVGSGTSTDTYDYKYKSPTSIYVSYPYYKVLPTATGENYTIMLPAGTHSFSLIITMPAYGRIDYYSATTPWALAYVLSYSSTQMVKVTITPYPDKIEISLDSKVSWRKMLVKITSIDNMFTYNLRDKTDFDSPTGYKIISSQTGGLLPTDNVSQLATSLSTQLSVDSFSKIVPAIRVLRDFTPTKAKTPLIHATLPEPMTYDSPLDITPTALGKVKLLSVSDWSQSLIIINRESAYTVATILTKTKNSNRVSVILASSGTIGIPWNYIIQPPTTVVTPDVSTTFWLWWVSTTGPRIELQDPDGVSSTFTPTVVPVKITLIVGR